MSTPSKNLYWKDIKTSDHVEETKTLFIVNRDGEQYVAYWEGKDATTAQRCLKHRALRDAFGMKGVL